MSKRPSPDDPGAPATATNGSPDDSKLTSDDIFGDVLEEVGGERLGASERKPGGGNRGPIKVQVSEPLIPGGRPAHRPASALPVARRPVKELRPEDVDALLDAFSGPLGDVPPEPLPEPLPEESEIYVPEPELAAEPVLEADDAVATPPEPEPPPVLLELDDVSPPWMNDGEEQAERGEELPPPPPSARARSDDVNEEGLRDLMNLMRVNKGRAHRMD